MDTQRQNREEPHVAVLQHVVDKKMQFGCNLISVQYVKDASRLLLSALPRAGISFTVPPIKLKNVIVVMICVLEGREGRGAKSSASGMWI